MTAIDDLKGLAAIEGPCLSIYEPVRDAFSQVTKTDTRLVAAAQKADALLREDGMGPEDRERFLGPIVKLAKNTDWSGRNGSVAIFRAPGFTNATFWPDALEEQIRLGDEFFILPLLPGLSSQRNFWVLSLSINRIRLMRGTSVGFTEVELPENLPRSLIEAGGFDPPEGDLESRSAAGPSVGNMGAVRFGTGSVNETQNRYLHDFFRTIDRAIHPILTHGGHDPLILAAVPRELAIYREINTYPLLVEEAIHGSPDSLGDERLHRTALTLIAADKSEAERTAREAESAAGRGLLATDVGAIRRAAANGQVERLVLHPRIVADTDVWNAAAMDVMRHGGSIVCREPAGEQSGACAILRYRVPEAGVEPAPAAVVA